MENAPIVTAPSLLPGGEIGAGLFPLRGDHAGVLQQDARLSGQPDPASLAFDQWNAHLPGQRRHLL